MQKDLTITFDDVVGQSATVTFTNIGDRTNENVKTLVQGIVARLKAGVKQYAITETYERESANDDTTFPVPKDDGEFDTVDQKCVYTFRRKVGEGDDADTAQSTIQLPAPQATDFEKIPKQGKRYTKEAGDDIADKIKTFFGDASNARFVEGWFKSKK